MVGAYVLFVTPVLYAKLLAPVGECILALRGLPAPTVRATQRLHHLLAYVLFVVLLACVLIVVLLA
jgi:hypothetical protein